MKSNWLTHALLVLAVGGAVAWLASKTYWDEIDVPTPPRGEAVTNPFYAAEKFAATLGARAEWRHTLGTLPTDDTVVFLSQWHWDLIESRRQAIESWVNAGGHLVLDSSLIGGDDGLSAWAGIWREYPEDKGDAAANDSEADMQLRRARMLLAGEACAALQPVDAQGNAREAKKLSICKLDGLSALRTERDIAWGLADELGLQALRVNVGRGSVTWINGQPFGNRDLTEADHATLFVDATQLRHGTHLIFISERKNSSLLGLMWQHGAPVVVLASLMVAALLWRGGLRFGPMLPPPDSARRSLAEQIRGTGRFTVRLGGGKALHSATLRALHEAARRHLARYENLPHTERIAALSAATGSDPQALADAINYSGPRRPSELAQALATLETARRHLNRLSH